MRFWKRAALAVVLGALAGCSPVSVHYDYDRAAPFASFRTYRWFAGDGQAKPKPPAAAHPIMERRVHRIVEAQLAARGFRPAEGEPDFLVACYPVFRDRLVATYTGFGPAWGYYGWGVRPWDYGVGMGFQEVQRYREGSLVLEMVDPRTNQVVWHAVAEGALTGLKDPQDAEEQVSLAVKKMLDRFPPAATPR
jgi:hypothetical protein